MMSLDTNNQLAKKRGIGKKLIPTVRSIMLEEHVDMVAGDGAHHAAITDDSPALLKKPSLIRTCGFLNSLDSETDWQVRMHGAFTIPHGTLGLKEKDQSCHHEVWIHLSHINARVDETNTPNGYT